MTPALDQLMTAEEFMKLPDPPDGARYELVKGRVICVAPASVRSNIIAIEIVVQIAGFVRPRKLGVYGGSEAGFRLSTNPDIVRAPDAWFVRAERIPADGIPDQYWPGTPDLAVEVLSPSDRAGDIFARLRDYLTAGTRLIWVIDPRTRSAVIFRLAGLPSFVSEDEALDGEEVLPGFSLVLRDVLSAAR